MASSGNTESSSSSSSAKMQNRTELVSPALTPTPEKKGGWRRLAGLLGVELDDDTEVMSRGESVYSGYNQDVVYIESEPTVLEWLKQFHPTTHGIWMYLFSLVPFVTWIGRYNKKWAMGDIIAGVTVGCVVIPQGSEFSTHNG